MYPGFVPKTQQPSAVTAMDAPTSPWESISSEAIVSCQRCTVIGTDRRACRSTPCPCHSPRSSADYFVRRFCTRSLSIFCPRSLQSLIEILYPVGLKLWVFGFVTLVRSIAIKSLSGMILGCAKEKGALNSSALNSKYFCIEPLLNKTVL